MRERWSPDTIILAVIVSVLVVYEIVAIMTGTVDTALRVIYSWGWTEGVYGILWTWLNPFWWTMIPYQIYLSIFVAVTIGGMFWLVRRGKLPFIVVFACQVTNIMWAWLAGYQHITMTIFQALSFWNPLFMVGWLFQLIPFGNDVGWSCLIGGESAFYEINGTTYRICGEGHLWGSQGLIVWHLIQLVWAVVPTAYWTVKFTKALRRKGLGQMFRGMLP